MLNTPMHMAFSRKIFQTRFYFFPDFNYVIREANISLLITLFKINSPSVKLSLLKLYSGIGILLINTDKRNKSAAYLPYTFKTILPVISE